MYVKEVCIYGECELCLYYFVMWCELMFFLLCEWVVFVWIEVLMILFVYGVLDDFYDCVCGQFLEKELLDLMFEVMVINGWNCVNVVFWIVLGLFDKVFGFDKVNFV